MVLCIQEVAHRHRLKIGTLGHMGDGNLHPTFLTNETNKEEMCRVEEAMKEIFAHHGAGATLPVKAVFKPAKDFHMARHTLFSAEQNLEIDKVVPGCASVKTKLGRGGVQRA